MAQESKDKVAAVTGGCAAPTRVQSKVMQRRGWAGRRPAPRLDAYTLRFNRCSRDRPRQRR